MAFTKMKQRRALAAEWTFDNTILSEGEIGFEKDTNKFKFGNGTSGWNALPYVEDSRLGTHLTDPIDVHDASAVSFIPVGTLASTDVQGALAELDTEKSGTAHTHAAVGGTAATTSFSPSGNIAATNVQTALVELDTEKSGTAHTHLESIYLQAQLVSGTVAVATHVLKPGVRVPAAATLNEVVLRCETAPVGAAITVTTERFNGGVSQGIIATTSIAAGANVGSTSNLTAACSKGDMLKFNVTTVGSTTAGADLTTSLELR